MRPRPRRLPWLVVGFVAASGLASCSKPTPAAPQGVQSFSDLARDHVQGSVSYPETPPVGGPHAARWQNCGFYDEPVPNENAVHSLEHGAFWINYRPDIPAGDRDKLRALAAQSYVLVSPYFGLDVPVVASAWGRQLRLSDPNDARLDQFVRAFRQGRQSPEPGAPCEGGVGQPSK